MKSSQSSCHQITCGQNIRTLLHNRYLYSYSKMCSCNLAFKLVEKKANLYFLGFSIQSGGRDQTNAFLNCEAHQFSNLHGKLGINQNKTGRKLTNLSEIFIQSFNYIKRPCLQKISGIQFDRVALRLQLLLFYQIQMLDLAL